ncbi:MAG: hypothetical protein CVV24_08485 [Ignavibacteriae bacterium HGW-Ignavibacteriae-3]|nr:MAG: hypothetical protein CVV24_08485 [Ignavibacteriae bacterium HGW-Ignavibacteriae-3]
MKKHGLLFFGIFFAIIINLSAQSPLNDGEKAIKNKEYEKALAIANEFVAANNTADAFKLLIPLEQKEYKNKKLYESFGDAYAKMNVAENAISYYHKAEAMDSLDIPLKFKLAELFAKVERYTEAVNTYLKIVDIDPKNAKAYLEGGSILFKAKLYADAATMFEKYIALEQTEDAYVKITKAFLETRNYEKTNQFAIAGLNKYPNNSSLKKGAAISSFALQNFEASGKFYQAIPDSEMTVSDLKNAGTAFQQVGADSIAIKYFEKVIEKDSTQSSLFMSMANTYYSKKNYVQAIKYYHAKLSSDSTYEPAHRYLGFAYYDLKDLDNARASLLKARSLVDTTFVTNYYLAQIYSRMDSTEQASKQYSIVMRLGESNERQYRDYILEAVTFLGQRAFVRKAYNDAIVYYRKANQIRPNEWRFMESLGACYQAVQNYDEAIRWYCATLKFNSKSEAARKGLRMMSADDCVPSK